MQISVESEVRWNGVGTRWGARGKDKHGNMLVMAVLRGVREQLQDTGPLSINAFEPGISGHDDQIWNEECIARVFDEPTGEQLDSEQVQLTNSNEIEFLRTVSSVRESP